MMSIPCRSCLALLASLLLAGCGGKDQPEPILLGQVVPSGPLTSLAEQAHRGVLLAVAEVNKGDQFIAGRRVAVLQPDCRPDKESVRALGVRLVTVNKAIGLLGGTDPVLADALATLAESSKVPLVAAGGLPGRAAGGFAFRTGPAPAYQGRALARFATTQFPGQTIIVLINVAEGAGPAHSALAGAFAGEYRRGGGRISGEWTFKAATELKDLASRLGAEKAAALMLAGEPNDLGGLQKAGLDEKLPVLLGGPADLLAALRSDPVKPPVYAATTFLANQGPAPAQEFARKYQERFQEPATEQAALAYDGARLMVEGLRRAKELDGPKVREALADVKNFEGVTGTMRFDADHWAVRTLFVVRVEGGKENLVETVEPPDGDH